MRSLTPRATESALHMHPSLARSFSSVTASAVRQVPGTQLDYTQRVTIPVPAAPGAAAHLCARPKPPTTPRMVVSRAPLQALLANQVTPAKNHPTTILIRPSHQKSNLTAARLTPDRNIHLQRQRTDRRRYPEHQARGSMGRTYLLMDLHLHSTVGISLTADTHPAWNSDQAAGTCMTTPLLLLTPLLHVLPVPLSVAQNGYRPRLDLCHTECPAQPKPPYQSGPSLALCLQAHLRQR